MPQERPHLQVSFPPFLQSSGISCCSFHTALSLPASLPLLFAKLIITIIITKFLFNRAEPPRTRFSMRLLPFAMVTHKPQYMSLLNRPTEAIIRSCKHQIRHARVRTTPERLEQWDPLEKETQEGIFKKTYNSFCAVRGDICKGGAPYSTSSRCFL